MRVAILPDVVDGGIDARLARQEEDGVLLDAVSPVGVVLVDG